MSRLLRTPFRDEHRGSQRTGERQPYRRPQHRTISRHERFLDRAAAAWVGDFDCGEPGSLRFDPRPHCGRHVGT